MSVGAGNYVTKVAANGEFKSKSLQEYIVDGAISSVVWVISRQPVEQCNRNKRV